MKSRRVQRPKSAMPTAFCLSAGILFLLFLVLGIPSLVQAAAGDLDPSFGSGGKVTTPVGSEDDEANALAVQTDGKIVAAGYTLDGLENKFALVRYNSNGSVDTGFGSGGEVITAVGTDDDKAFGLAIQSDGKIVAAGYSLQPTMMGAQYEFALVRYNPDGSLDTTFNPCPCLPGHTAGIVTTAIGMFDAEAFSLAIQSDGKLVLAGRANNGSQNEFALVRYNPDGSLDTTFNPCPCLPGHMAGIVTTAIGTLDDEAFALAIQPDGNLVAAGYTDNGSQNEFALVRYNTDGSPDTTFGTGGIVTTAVGNQDDKANSVVIQPDGKVAAGGYFYNGLQYEFAVARYNTDGTPDEDFGEVAVTPIGMIDDKAFAMVLQTDGKLVLAGYSFTGAESDFALARFNTDGSLDTSFGTNGIVTTAVGTLSDKILALAIQPDEKLIVAGSSYNGQYNFGLVRYLNDVTTTTTTTTTTSTTTTSTEATTSTTTTSTTTTSTTTTTTTTSTTTSTGATTTTTTTSTTTTSTTSTTTSTGATTTTTTTSTTTTITTNTTTTTTSTTTSTMTSTTVATTTSTLATTTTTRATTTTTVGASTTTSTRATTTTVAATTTTTTTRPTLTTTTTTSTTTTRPTTTTTVAASTTTSTRATTTTVAATTTTTTTRPTLTTTTTTSTTTTRPTTTSTTTTTTTSTTSTTLAHGRMTGGGSIISGDLRATHGFELHCDLNQNPNNLEVNWGSGNSFHLESLTTASCSDNPAILPNPPKAGFDTYHGTGTGRYNGVSGATAEWTFTDAGEPGNNDTATIVIKDAGGNIVLSVSGNLSGGNQQAHK